MINNKVEAIKEHIKAIMEILEIPVTESNKNTPLRIAKMWCNEVFENTMCEHHWLPFSGTVTVGYVPCDTIVGLSKIPRVVRYFSRKPQLQEQLTTEIGEFLEDLLEPRAIFVEVTATHQCVKCRGAESDCSTKTYYKSICEGFESSWQEFKDRM